MLDVVDFTTNPAVRQLGRFGTSAVRYGKAMCGSPPRRRQVATVMPWAAEVVEEYVTDVRPCYAASEHPALFLTERGERISLRQVDERFAVYRAGAGLPDKSHAALPAALLHFAPHRRRCRPDVCATPGRSFLGLH